MYDYFLILYQHINRLSLYTDQFNYIIIYCMVSIASSWHEINSIADDETGVENQCLCYPVCNQTTYAREILSTPYPGPAANTDTIIKEVFRYNPTDSHICYAK